MTELQPLPCCHIPYDLHRGLGFEVKKGFVNSRSSFVPKCILGEEGKT